MMPDELGADLDASTTISGLVGMLDAVRENRTVSRSAAISALRSAIIHLRAYGWTTQRRTLAHADPDAGGEPDYGRPAHGAGGPGR